jgi:[acyl-carrier-protein] S-malonyltransferase
MTLSQTITNNQPQVDLLHDSSPSLNKQEIAWVFAGQGSQVLGMGKDLWNVPYAQFRFKQAEQILGWSVVEICNQEAKMFETKYCQPSLFVICSILADLLLQMENYPDFLAGYSLGEYIALYVARVFDFHTGLQLVKQRAEIMEKAPPGMMVALIGCDRKVLEQLIQNTPNVELINDDRNQSIISGTHEAVENILSSIEARKNIPLNVSKPFHTQLMKFSQLAYQSVLNGVPFHNAQIPVLSNLDPIPTTSHIILKNRLHQHMTGKIRWQEICRHLEQTGIKKVVEISPSRVLTSQLKRNGLKFNLHNITNLKDILSIQL